MESKAFIVDANWCYGCHTCEVACQTEHGFPVEQTGIKVLEIGTWSYVRDGEEKWQKNFVALPTDQCDGCADRLKDGEQPTCVRHCFAACLKLGELGEIKAQATGLRQTVYVIS
jgi:anaerobic dimethyl sulfoxide reductase subunit B (iron-sulfur subunit)